MRSQFESRQGQESFLFLERRDQPWRPPSVISVESNAVPPGVKRSECEVVHSPPPRDGVKNKWSHTTIPLTHINGLHRGNLTFMFLVHLHYRQCRPMIQVKRFQSVISRRRTYRAVRRSVGRVYVKVRFFLSIPRRCVGGVEVCFHPMLTSALKGETESALNTHTVRTESDDTRGCNNTICPPEDEQGKS